MRNALNLFKKQNIIYKLMTIFLLCVILLFIGRVVKNTIVGLDYPNEILEPANVHLTNSLIHGNVPYARDNIVEPGTAEPPINYEYPFLNNIFAAAFSIFTGGNTVASHYLVSFLAMIGTAILGSVIILKNSRTTVGAVMGFLLLMFCHWRYGYISASPDGFGLFVTMLTLYLAVKPELKHRALICAIGTVAAFYSKQYYAAVCISIFVYFFIYARKESLKYFVWCVVLLGASIVIVNIFWPVYWVYSILCLFHGCFQGWDISGFANVLNQLKYLAFVFAGMLVVLIVALLQKIRKNHVKTSDGEITIDETSNTETSNIEATGGTELPVLPLFLIQILVQTLVLFFIGRNDGAYLTYFLQLLIPSLCISTLIIMEKMEVGKAEIIFMGAYGMLMVFTVYFGWAKLPMHMLTDEDVTTWKRAYAIIDEYRGKGEVYHCKNTVYNAIENGDPLFATGHDGDITEAIYEEYLNNSFQQFMFPDARGVYEENLAYREVMKNRVMNQEIAMIVTSGGGNCFISDEEIEEAGYVCVDEMGLQLGNMNYNTRFWGLKK